MWDGKRRERGDLVGQKKNILNGTLRKEKERFIKKMLWREKEHFHTFLFPTNVRNTPGKKNIFKVLRVCECICVCERER